MKFQPPWMRSPLKQSIQPLLQSPNRTTSLGNGENDTNSVARGLFNLGLNLTPPLNRDHATRLNPTTPTKREGGGRKGKGVFFFFVEGPSTPINKSPPRSVSPFVLRTRPGTTSPARPKPKIDFTPDTSKDRWTNMAEEAKLVARARKREINQERRKLFVEKLKSNLDGIMRPCSAHSA